MDTTIQVIPSHKNHDALLEFYQDENIIHSSKGQKVFIGDRINKVCRFCGKDSSKTSFRNEAHLLPEFMGNRLIFSHFECDTCNSLFSKYETAFANYFGVQHTFGKVTGKNKTPKYKSRKEGLEVVPDNDGLNIFSSRENDSVQIDAESQRISLTTTRPSYIPREVFKCLVKVGFCAIKNEDLKNYELTRKWLLNEMDEGLYPTHPLFTVYYNIGGGLRTKTPFVALLKRRIGMPVPQSTALIAYEHFKFQLFIPFDSRDEQLWQNRVVKLPVEQHLVRLKSDGITAEIYSKDLSSMEKVIGERHTFSMGFTDGQFLNSE